MLLHWGTLEPCGSSKLASVRFSGPVRIRSIRIHPNGAPLFSNNPEAISQTDPGAFTLSVFLNAQPAPTAQEPKPKGTNVLVPTKLAYAGGLREFPLDMGPDFVTRLMVVQGDFARVTIALYGDAISEPPVIPYSYEPAALPTVSRYHLSAAVDPSNAADPTLLPRNLLALIPDAPSLQLAIRLVCCLTVPEEGLRAAGSTFTDLGQCLEDDSSGLDWLEKAYEELITPVRDDIDIDIVKKFAGRALEALSDKTNEHVYVLAGILRVLAAQPGIVACTMMDSFDMADLLESSLLDIQILDRLRDAAANPAIARALRTPPALEVLQSLRDTDSSSRPLKDAAARLLQRVLGWERFEKALSAAIPDLAAVARWVKDIASDETTLGIFLLSMIEDESLVSKLDRHPVQEQSVPPPALWVSTGIASSTEFVAFMRTFVGVSCVMAIFSWADSVSNEPCTEHILAILRLWQEVDGYREIVNHLLLNPGLAYRIEHVLKNSSSSPPSPSSLHVEQILASLLANPESMIRPELASLVNALPSSPSFISGDERLEMVEVSMIAEGGLPQAVRTLLNWSDRPVHKDGARALQTALLIVKGAVEDRETGEQRVMQAAWDNGSHGLVYQLVELFQRLVGPIRDQFLLTPPPPLQPLILAHLLSSSNATMRILSRLLPVYPLPRRLTRALTHQITTLFIATDAVDSRSSQGSAACQAARVARPTCAEALSVLSSIPDESEPDSTGGELVLRTLLRLALYPEGDDPVARMEQVFWLLDLVLPLSLSEASGDRTEQRFWTRKVIPNLLPELQCFLRALAVDLQVQLVRRLMALDRGEVGLGQWFVDEELKYLLAAVENLKAPQPETVRRLIAQARVASSFQLLSELMEHSPGNNPELFRESQTLQNISRVLASLLEYPVTIPGVLDFVGLLAPEAALMETQSQLDMVITLLRNSGLQTSALLHAGTILPLVDHASPYEPVRIAAELGPALQRLADDEASRSGEDEALAQAVVSCLSWLVRQPEPEILLLPGIAEASFTELLERVALAASHNRKLVSEFRAKFVFSEDVVIPLAQDDPETLTISVDGLAQLLNAKSTTPSTPRLSGESIFKMATMSPIAALVGSSRISTLTKTYQNNDFRQLSVRQNTSRRPSMHVDDFEQGGPSSPIAVHSSPPTSMISAEFHLLLPPPNIESE